MLGDKDDLEAVEHLHCGLNDRGVLLEGIATAADQHAMLFLASFCGRRLLQRY